MGENSSCSTSMRWVIVLQRGTKVAGHQLVEFRMGRSTRIAMVHSHVHQVCFIALKTMDATRKGRKVAPVRCALTPKVSPSQNHENKIQSGVRAGRAIVGLRLSMLCSYILWLK